MPSANIEIKELRFSHKLKCSNNYIFEHDSVNKVWGKNSIPLEKKSELDSVF